MGIDPALQIYVNLWTDDSVTPTVPWQRVARLKEERTRGVVIVALGQRVSRELVRRGVDHVAIVHPAARGRIRKRERYVAQQYAEEIKERPPLEKEKRPPIPIPSISPLVLILLLLMVFMIREFPVIVVFFKVSFF